MQVILDSSFARPGSAPIWGGKKGEFRDWTTPTVIILRSLACGNKRPRCKLKSLLFFSDSHISLLPKVWLLCNAMVILNMKYVFSSAFR